MSIEFEVVRPEDAAALAKLKAETFAETFAKDNDPAHVQAHLAREFTAQAVERTLKDERSTTWWLLDDGVPVGFLKVNRGDAQTEPNLADGLEVEQIYVLASHHGQGLGSRLMECRSGATTARRFSVQMRRTGVRCVGGLPRRTRRRPRRSRIPSMSGLPPTYRQSVRIRSNL